MTCAAIVAVKATAAAKSRLRDALPVRQHDRLVEAMLRHVLRAAGAARSVAEVFLVSPEQRPGSDWPPTIIDTANDLNAAFDLGAHAARARRHDAVLLLPADLATVTAADLDAFVECGTQVGAALAADRGGTGTNALWMTLARPLRLAFGPSSFARHYAECERLRLVPASVQSPTLSLDIDTALDLAQLRGIDEYNFLWSSERSVA